MNVAAFRSSQPTLRRCVAHRLRCRRFRKEEFFDHSSRRHRSFDPIARLRGLTTLVSFGLWPGVPVETWSEIPRVELTIVLHGFTRRIRGFCVNLSRTHATG